VYYPLSTQRSLTREALVNDIIQRRDLFSRRDFARMLLAFAPAAGFVGRGDFASGLQAKPNSTWGGVPFGIFAPRSTELVGGVT
jgi:hypothetical protein